MRRMTDSDECLLRDYAIGTIQPVINSLEKDGKNLKKLVEVGQ